MKFIGVPVQPLSVGVTFIVPIIFDPVPLAGAFHVGILPEPLAAIPIAVLELVHEKVAPVGLLIKLPMLIGTPGQTAILLICSTVGVG